jgi:hypothetical protein
VQRALVYCVAWAAEAPGTEVALEGTRMDSPIAARSVRSLCNIRLRSIGTMIAPAYWPSINSANNSRTLVLAASSAVRPAGVARYTFRNDFPSRTCDERR